jgi:hypothetical protein
MKGRRRSFHCCDSLRTNMAKCTPNNSTLVYACYLQFVIYILSLMYIHYNYKFIFYPESVSSSHCLTRDELNWQVNTVLKLNIIHSVHFIFIFKFQQMYNLITLIVYFHCPTCFEPLIWVHLQGHII